MIENMRGQGGVDRAIRQRNVEQRAVRRVRSRAEPLSCNLERPFRNVEETDFIAAICNLLMNRRNVAGAADQDIGVVALDQRLQTRLGLFLVIAVGWRLEELHNTSPISPSNCDPPYVSSYCCTERSVRS